MKTYKGYIFGRPFMGERVPQHVQNIVLRDFARRKDVRLLLSASEYALENSDLVLQTVVGNLGDADGIMMYSVFQLPADRESRFGIWKEMIERRKEIMFAVEDLYVSNLDDVAHVELIWGIRLALQSEATVNS